MDKNTIGILVLVLVLVLIYVNRNAFWRLFGILLTTAIVLVTVYAIMKQSNSWLFMVLVGIAGFALAGKVAEWFHLVDFSETNNRKVDGGPIKTTARSVRCNVCIAKPGYRICTECHGVGSIPQYMQPDKFCYRCSGSGYVQGCTAGCKDGWVSSHK